nr:hypothetical protein [uncultured Desulfobacter sp.]
MTKLEIALGATLFGWLLAQATEVIKTYLHTSSKKKAVVEEMFELKMLLNDGAESAKKSAFKCGENGIIGFSIGAQLSTPVFDSYYPEVADKFTDWARFNIRTFYNHLQHYNDAINWLQTLKSGEVTTTEIKFKLFEAYKQASLAVVYLEGSDESGGKEKITDSHPKLSQLRETIQKKSKELFPVPKEQHNT